MYKHTVYLDKKNNRLLILSSEITKEGFLPIYYCTATNEEVSLRVCKSFCIGYIMGTSLETPINDINEFH